MGLVHGGDIYSLAEKKQSLLADFSANINPLGMPPAVEQAAAKALKDCQNYPDPLCRELRAAIASFEGVSQEQVICGNGAADLIFRLALAVKPKKAVLPAPTFAEYEQALKTVGCRVFYHNLDPREEFRVTERILEDLTEEMGMLFLCNPNNPTGQLIDPGLLQKILEHCRRQGILLVMDECFNDFLEEPEKNTLKRNLLDCRQLFILKAFTKIYAMAGLRLGYGLCSNTSLLEKMMEVGQPWGVSIPAQKAGVQALKETEYRRETAALISCERVWLRAQLEAAGVKVMGSQANYLFFHVPGCNDLKERLLEHGILVRSCGNYPGLDGNYYRAAVRAREENQLFIRALVLALGHGGDSSDY